MKPRLTKTGFAKRWRHNVDAPLLETEKAMVTLEHAAAIRRLIDSGRKLGHQNTLKRENHA